MPPAAIEASTVMSTAHRLGARLTSASSRNGGEKIIDCGSATCGWPREHERVPPRPVATREAVGKELDLRLEMRLCIPGNCHTAEHPRPGHQQEGSEKHQCHRQQGPARVPRSRIAVDTGVNRRGATLGRPEWPASRLHHNVVTRIIAASICPSVYSITASGRITPGRGFHDQRLADAVAILGWLDASGFSVRRCATRPSAQAQRPWPLYGGGVAASLCTLLFPPPLRRTGDMNPGYPPVWIITSRPIGREATQAPRAEGSGTRAAEQSSTNARPGPRGAQQSGSRPDYGVQIRGGHVGRGKFRGEDRSHGQAPDRSVMGQPRSRSRAAAEARLEEAVPGHRPRRPVVGRDLRRHARADRGQHGRAAARPQGASSASPSPC